MAGNGEKISELRSPEGADEPRGIEIIEDTEAAEPFLLPEEEFPEEPETAAEEEQDGKAAAESSGLQEKTTSEKEQDEPESREAVPEEEEQMPAAEEEQDGKADPKEAGKGKRKPFSVKAALAGAVLAAALRVGAAGYYIYESRQYRTVFFPNTVINGMDASQKTVDQVKDMLAAGAEEYELTIRGRGGITDVIAGDEIGLHTVFDGSLERYLSSQKPLTWWNHRKTPAEYMVQTSVALDEDMLSERIDGLAFFDRDNIQEPRDACLSDYIPGEGYMVVPEEEGNHPVKRAVAEIVSDAALNLQPELSLDEADVYMKPAVTSEDAGLNARAAELNQYVKTVITYQFGERTEELNGDTIVNWMAVGDDGTVTLDPEQIAGYVKALAEKYDTVGLARDLKTTYGAVVSVPKGNYGWKIDQEEEARQLLELVNAGESMEREPVYSQTACSRGENDYGDTYVEINLTAQHLYFYKEGRLVIDSDFVSGSHARGHDTPAGAYRIAYKQRDRVLRGERRADGSYEYQTPVSYWMPFNGGIGLHDATWRGSFGGKIYLTNGSHGCINLPKSAAKTIYENIDAGTPVLCYHLENTSGAAQTPAGPEMSQ